MDLSDQIAALNPQPGERFSLNWILPGQKMTSVVLEPHQIPAAADALPSNADIWIGMNPVGPQVTSGRGTSADVTRLTSLYADLDDKPGGCPAGVAEKVIDELCKLLGEDCTYMTFSGHGIHPVWVIEPEDASNADIDKLIRRWGRLVKHVAKQHGGQADSVFDLARILRAIGTLNNKESVPVEVAGIPGAGGPMTLDQVRERLDEAGIFEEEEEDASEVKEPVPQRGWAATECWYAAQTFAGWQTEIPKQGRHPWLTGQFTRLEAMKILGCLTASQYATGTRVLGERFAALCVGGVGGEKRPVGRYEIADCQDWGKKRAAAKSRPELLAEVGNHEHDMFGDIVKDRGSQGLSGGSTGPFGVGQPGPTIPGDTEETEPNSDELFTRIFEAEADFWTATAALKQIYEASMAKMVAPWAVFANCVGRALTLVPSTVHLPALIGGPGSLNWFAVIVEKSSAGKSAAMAVAEELVSPMFGEIHEKNIGSGEGMIKQFYMPDPNDPKRQIRREAVLFTTDEIDSMTAMSQRQGGTTLSVLRTAFTAGTLGFSYVASGRDVHVRKGSYRMCFLMNAQPGRCGALLADHAGGTPQRFMWFPATDRRPSRATADRNYWPTPMPLPALATLGQKEIQIPSEAEDMIYEAREMNLHGDVGALDGHSLFAREKLAYGLALLDGRTDMGSEDWRLSGIAAEVSSRTRAWVQSALAEQVEDEAKDAGRLRGVGFAAADEEKAHQAVKRQNRIENLILKHLAAGPLTEGAIRKRVHLRDKPWVRGALDSLASRGLVTPPSEGENTWAAV